jgi:NAD(P)-dependent dehydrogenase (short-subunit alcohol dehydrogenase family)
MIPATILVTGSSGRGRQMVETLARRGHTVFASLRASTGKNANAAIELRDMAQAERLALEVLDLDVTDAASIQAAVKTIVRRAGRIDVVINNAGFGLAGISEAMSIEQVQHMFDVNLFGALRVNQAALPYMRRQRAGLLVYIASTASRLVAPMLGVYSAAKAALDTLARGFAYELHEFGIDTTIIHAGGFATNFGHNLVKAADSAVWDAYGATAQQASIFVDSMSAAFAPGVASDPERLADLVADLVAMPTGSRPLCVPIGMGSEGLEPINQAIEAQEHQMLRMCGRGHLIACAPAESIELEPELSGYAV